MSFSILRPCCALIAGVFAVTVSAGRAHAAPNPVVVGAARFTVLAPQCVRVEYAPDGFTDAPSYFAANRKARFDDFQLSISGATTTIDTGAIQLNYTPDGKAFSPTNLRATIVGGATWTPGVASTGNLGGTNRTLDGANGPVDVGQGVLSRDGWYLLDDSRGPLLVDNWVKQRPATAGSDWYLFGYGTDYRAALKALTAVGGPVPLPRRYALGAWYSRFWPYTSDEFRDIAKEYDEHGFPLDVMVLDMDWHLDGWTGWSWNRKLIPDPPQLLADLHADGLHVPLNLHPADGVRPYENRYPEFMRALGLDPASGQTVPYDSASQPYVKALLNEVMAPLERDGVDFWWLDWQQERATRSMPEVTNLAWLNQVLYQETASGDKRGLSFSRWAGWGDHRHPIHFSGDADSGWATLRFEVPFTSTAGNVGCFYWSHDIGGHNGGRNEESYARWCQFGATSAALRSHSQRDATMDRRPWKYPQWAEDSMRVSFRLRSQLFPYIYTSTAQSSRDSVPLTRPMYIDYPQTEAAYHQPGQFLLGDNLLVAPISMPGVGPQRVGHQTVWFPANSTWFNLLTDEKYQGGAEKLVAADINEFPIFARAGVPLPLQPYAARMTTAPLNTLRVRCYPGASGQTGRANLYQDDGETDAYKSGKTANTPLSYARRGDDITLTVGPTTGAYDGQLGARALQIELPATQRATRVRVNGQNARWFYNAAAQTNVISVPARSIRQNTTVTLRAADADPQIARAQAMARRLSGVVGAPVARQAAAQMLQAALDRATSPEQREEVLAVAGIGLVNKDLSPTGHRELIPTFYAPLGTLDGGQLRVGSATLRLANPTAPLPGALQRVDFSLNGRALFLPASELFDQTNVAPLAKISVSGTEGGYGFAGATDRNVSGYPSDRNAEWSSGTVTGGTLTLTWNTPQTINRIALYDRPNEVDQILAGTLTFDDGTSLAVGALPNDGKTPLELKFAPKTIKSVVFQITAAKAGTEHNGLSEIAVYRAP